MQFGASVSQFKKAILLFSKDIMSITFFNVLNIYTSKKKVSWFLR